MKKRITLIALLLTFVCMQAIAQERTIAGKVTSSQDKMGIPGVSAVVAGTTNGTTTDMDGNYKLTVSADAKQLKFSGVGLKSQTLDIGASTTMDVVMENDVLKLDEVVVTALGVSREKKSLGYSTQEVSGEQLSTVKSGSFINQLSGKVSGVQIRNNGNMGGSTNIIVRGSTSLLGDNQALFIVDGIPMDNSRSNGQFQNRGTSGYDYGSPVSDINPDDIESVNVLKGGAATALYGSRAARGVILITTKKGKIMSSSSKKRLGVTFNSNVTMGMVDKETFPTYQKEYGAGYGPYYDGQGGHFYLEDVNGDGNADEQVTVYTEDASYGEKFDPSLMIYQWAAFVPNSPTYHQATPWVDHASNEKEGPISFFETAMGFTNSVAIDGGSDKGTFRVSVGHTDETGILPNSSLKKYNLGVNSEQNFTDKFSAGVSYNHVRQETVGRNETGYNNNTMTSFRQWYQTNVSVKEMKDIYEMTDANFGWNPASSSDPAIPIFWDNPYFLRYKSFASDNRDRDYGHMNLNYKVTDHINIMARAAIDMYSTLQEERLAKISNAKQFGIAAPGQTAADATSGYSRLNKNARETNLDIIANYKKDFSANLSFNGLVGTNFRRTYLNTILAATNGGLVVPELYSISNSVNSPIASLENEREIGVNGYFANASIGFKRFLFLDVTGRMDVSSTLPVDNNSYFYPGVSASFVFSEKLKAKWLDFGKVRVNYAQLGNDAPWGSLDDVYSKPIAFGSTTLFSLPVTKNNSELLPEISSTIETGLEMIFFNRRLGFDLAWYTTDTKNQILPVSVSYATGYSSKFVNAGIIRNSGIEVNLYGTPVKTANFSWTLNLNWSTNKNEVVELFDGVDNLQLANFQGGVTLNATVGESINTLKGTDFVYDPSSGKRVVKTNGYYQITTDATNVIGTLDPDFIAGVTNTLTYKKWSFSFLIDMKQGGSVYSLDMLYGLGTGLYPESVGNNDLGNPVRNTLADGGGVILDGVQADGSANTIRVAADDYRVFGWARNPNSLFVYDASYVKLREASITYKFPLKEKCFFSNIAFGIVGSNLWIISKELPYADPEAGLSAGNIQGYQTGVMPTTRNFGFNLTLQF